MQNNSQELTINQELQQIGAYRDQVTNDLSITSIQELQPQKREEVIDYLKMLDDKENQAIARLAELKKNSGLVDVQQMVNSLNPNEEIYIQVGRREAPKVNPTVKESGWDNIIQGILTLFLIPGLALAALLNGMNSDGDGHNG